MARGSLWNMANRRKNQLGVAPPAGGGVRTEDEGDPIWSAPDEYAAPPIAGQQQYGPWNQSYLGAWMDYIGGGFGAWSSDDSPDSWFDFQGVTSMSDLNDWWEAYGGSGDSFYDWLMNQNYYGAQFGGTSEQPGYGGGGQGGAGDLGTGNVFMGGGMGSSMFGEGLQGQDCSNIGPQFNSAGECIACCEEQYAGQGFYGTGEEYEGEGGSIDPDIEGDCASMYAQSGGFDMTQLSYTEFESLYCP